MTPRKPRDRILAGAAVRTQPDRRLLILSRAGDETAVEEVVRRYRPALVRYAASIVPPDRADDVVQDSLARALPEIRSGEAELCLRPWLYTIVRNTALNDLRDAGPPHDRLDESYDGVEQLPQTLERSERMRSLLASIRELPDAQREALVKREMEGRSHAAIGAELGVSAGAARQLIHRARTALREGIGSLIPMPVLRQLLDSEGAGGSGAVAVKAAVAVLATGAAVTAGIAIKDSRKDSRHAPTVALRSAAPGHGQRLPSPATRESHRLQRVSARAIGDRPGGSKTAGAGHLVAVLGSGAPSPATGGEANRGGGGGRAGHVAIGDSATHGAQGHGAGLGGSGGPRESSGGSGPEAPPQQPAGGSGEPPASSEGGEKLEAETSSDGGERESPAGESSSPDDSQPGPSGQD
jgi:RNA polymerase sigma factor (sigma-70 family)